MFFSTAKKATDTPPGRDVGAQAGSPSKKPATTATTTGILSILVFNPTLLPEGAEKQGEQEGPFGSNTSADSAEEEDASADGLSREEREQEAKIVYSYPPNREPEERRSQAGLLEGLLMYIKPFAPGELPLRSICTDKYIVVLEEVEQNYWFAMTFAANALPCFNATDPNQAFSETKRIDDDTQEDILLGVLRSCYATFRLLHGRIGLYHETGRRQELQDVLSDFCPAFVETVDCRKLSVFHGYHFGPVDRLPYLSVPSLVSLLQQNYPCIRHAALLMNGCLVYHSMNTPFDDRHPVGPRERGPTYSGLEFEDDALVVLYTYLVNTEGSAAVDMHKLLRSPYGRVPTAAARLFRGFADKADVQRRENTGTQNPGGGCSSFGRAITEDGPTDFIFGPVGGSLLAIVHEQLLLVLVLDESDERISDVSFLQSIRSAAVEGPCGLRELGGVLSAEFKKIMKQEDTYRFIYFNHANRAIRISNRPCPVNSPSPPYFKSFCLSFQEVQRAGHMHCKFLGLTETTADKNGSTFMCTYTPQSSPTSGSASRNEAAANAGESTSVEPQTNAQQGKGTVTASRNGERNKQCGLGILEGVRTIAVKDAQSGWLVGKRTCDREHFLALDDPKTTFKKALEDANRFSSLHFSNIFV